MTTDYEYCATCAGSGEGMHDGTICSRCKGKGVEPPEPAEDDFEEPDDFVDEWDGL